MTISKGGWRAWCGAFFALALFCRTVSSRAHSEHELRQHPSEFLSPKLNIEQWYDGRAPGVAGGQSVHARRPEDYDAGRAVAVDGLTLRPDDHSRPRGERTAAAAAAAHSTRRRQEQGRQATDRRKLEGDNDQEGDEPVEGEKEGLEQEQEDEDEDGDEEAKESGDPPEDEEQPAPTPAPTTPSTPAPTAAETTTPAPTPALTQEPTPTPTQAPTPAPTVSTPAPSSTEEPTVAPVPATPAPVDEEATTPEPVDDPVDDGEGSGENKVATPRFTGEATHSIMSYTDHIECDTEGATIRYTLDGSDPITTTTTSVREISPGDSVFVNKVGTITIRAVGTKDGMENSDEVQKTVTIQDQVHDPVLYFDGESAPAEETEEGAENAFLRTVAITMNCSTPNATLRYTVDGFSVPGDASPSVSPGTVVQWSEEGATEFRVVAVADGLYQSELTKWPVSILAPRTDEFPVATGYGEEQGTSGTSSGGDGGDSGDSGDSGDMLAMVEVTAFEAVYAAPAAELEQEEMLGPGYGGECEGGARVVRGKLLRLANPSRHFSFAPPPGACDGDGGEVLSPAADTIRAFQTTRQTAPLLDGETPAEARIRLDLDAREAAWRAAGGGSGCQAATAAGLLPAAVAAAAADGDAGYGESCAVGHLVGAGQVYNAEEGTGLVSFGVRGDSFVIGAVTADDVLDEGNPFEDLISGAGWLVRAGVNHVEASARDGHLDILRPSNAADDEAGDDADGGGDGDTEGDRGWLEDVLVAKLARTAIGHDAEGRLILLQTSGAAAGSDQDTAIPDGLDLSELADVLVEAGAVNAVNLIGGAPAAMVVNGSAIVDPAESCLSLSAEGGGGGGGGFADGSTLPLCDRPVSSIVCVHLDPPPLVEGSGDEDGVSVTPPPTQGSDPQPSSSAAAAGAVSSNADGDDWNSGWDSGGGGGDDDKEEVRLQWTRELCGGNDTGNGTASSLWNYVDDVEESVLRYKIAFWVVAVLGMMSLYFNIQHHKTKSSSAPSRSAELGGGAYGKQLQQQQQQQQHVGLINGTAGAKTGTSPAGVVVEMITKGRSSKRGSRGSSGSRRKRGSGGNSTAGGGGYARVNGDADWDDDAGAGGGARGIMMESDEEEEVDLGLGSLRSTSSSRRREKGKGGRLRKALSRISRGSGDGGGAAAGAPGHGGGDLDAAMAINPFGGVGGGGGRRDSGGAYGELRHEEGNWA